MNLSPECLSLSAHERFRHGDLSSVAKYLGVQFSPIRLRSRNLRPGGEFSHFCAMLGRIELSMNQYDFEGDKITMDATSGDFYLICLALSGSAFVRSGSAEGSSPPGYIFAVNPYMGCHQEFDSRYRKIVLRIDRPLLEAAYQQYTDKFPHRRIEFIQTPLPNDGAAQSLWVAIASACHELNNNKVTLLNRPRCARAYGAMVLSVLFETLQHSLSEDLGEPPSETMAPACIRRAENYIHENLTSDILMEDLAAVAGKSVRALHYGFCKHRGISPMQYLKECRLKLARSELEKADRTGRSVAEVALACGFTHLSKFASAYRQRFGEAPSQTRNGRLRAFSIY